MKYGVLEKWFQQKSADDALFFLAFTRDKDRWFQCSKNRFLKQEMPRQMFATVEETKPRRDLAHENVLWQQHKM